MKKLILGMLMTAMMVSQSNAQEEPLNVAEWQAAAEILTAARGLIEERGWYGYEFIAGAECMATAMEKAWLESGRTLVDFNYARMAMDETIGAPDIEVMDFRNDPLSTPYWGRYYMYWNDAQDRTEEEVLRAFNEAIAFAEASEVSARDAGLSGSDLQAFDEGMMQALGFRPSR